MTHAVCQEFLQILSKIDPSRPVLSSSVKQKMHFVVEFILLS